MNNDRTFRFSESEIIGMVKEYLVKRNPSVDFADYKKPNEFIKFEVECRELLVNLETLDVKE